MFWFAPNILCVRSAMQPADAIVLLGGSALHRAPVAAELFHRQLAPRILASGDGDAHENRMALMARGVPASAIQIEEKSRSTYENAQFSVRLLRAAGARRVIIVTSWFHTRRALHSFEAAAPEIEFLVQPADAGMERTLWHYKVRDMRHAVAGEYFKLAGYAVYYGVPLI